MDKAQIDSLKAANPILDVLKELGVEVLHNRFRCPNNISHAHGDRTPSVSVSPDRGMFKCWVCPDIKGDVISAVRLFQGLTFAEALKFLSQRSQNNLGELKISPFVTPISKSAKPEKKIPKPILTDESNSQRREIIRALLQHCKPISGKVAMYLQKRRVFKRTWDSQRLRMIDDYASISQKLANEFSLDLLEQSGIFNPAGHLRFYRHTLLFPYFDQAGQAIYLQARSIDPETKPKELSLAGAIPIPYNIRVLDEVPGQIYLCEGVIDTLTLIEQGFPAVGVPGTGNFKPAWVTLFKNKTVHVAFDPDAPGESGAKKAMDILSVHGVEVKRLAPPRGMDLNDWFLKG